MSVPVSRQPGRYSGHRGRRLAITSLVLWAVTTGCGSTVDSADTAAAWTNLRLTDVDGKPFALSEFAGKPVVVENFATWCSNCLRQLDDTQKAAAAAGGAAVFVALSVETEIDFADVAEYAKKNGFDNIRFAVMTPEFLAATSDAFGTTALNPPSTPKIIIGSDGTVGKTVTGFESPSDIAARLASTA